MRSIAILPWLGLPAALLLLVGCDSEQPEEPPTDPAPLTEIRTSGGPELHTPPLLSTQALELAPPPAAFPSGLETREWTVQQYGNPAQVLPVDMTNAPKARPGHNRLAVELYGGKDYATAINCDGEWDLQVDGKAQSILVIYNSTEAAMQASLAFTLSARHVWHESRTFVLKPGWNTVRIDQSASDFKTQKTQWQYTARLSQPWACYGITLLFHNGHRTGRLFIDHVSVAGRSRPRVETPQSPSPK